MKDVNSNDPEKINKLNTALEAKSGDNFKYLADANDLKIAMKMSPDTLKKLYKLETEKAKEVFEQFTERQIAALEENIAQTSTRSHYFNPVN